MRLFGHEVVQADTDIGILGTLKEGKHHAGYSHKLPDLCIGQDGFEGHLAAMSRRFRLIITGGRYPNAR